MDQLLKFTEYCRHRGYALDDLKQFKELIETIEGHDGQLGYKLKPLPEANRVTQRCQALIQYTWACRDYVKKILADVGILNPGAIVNPYIVASLEIKAISYLANEYKHAGVDASQIFGRELEPRLGKPYVLGIQQDFPFDLKPVFLISGDSLPGAEVSMKVSINNRPFQFANFDWKYSCMIEDKDGNPIGDTLDVCEKAFGMWLKILNDNGITT
jgi:hypothetical protein